jgi:hypothetical protein
MTTIQFVALAEYVDGSCQRKEKNDEYSQSLGLMKAGQSAQSERS